MPHFADRLHAAIRQKKTPALVGLDPRFELLPKSLQLGSDRRSKAEAIGRFCCEIIDVVAPLVAVVKPQSAFFECLGPAGVESLQQVICHARAKDLLVICDAKRGDIGSTAEAYAQAYLTGTDVDSAIFPADALTVNPYLGVDTLQPFLNVAKERGAGIYVLVRTSNPGAATFQDRTTDGRTLYEAVADELEQLAKETLGESGYGIAGAVVGATYPEELAALRKRMPHVPLLIPGYGAQGGGAGDVASAFDGQGLGAVINSSRGINFAFGKEPYATEFGEARWQDAVEAATKAMITDLAEKTPAGVLQDER